MPPTNSWEGWAWTSCHPRTRAAPHACISKDLTNKTTQRISQKRVPSNTCITCGCHKFDALAIKSAGILDKICALPSFVLSSLTIPVLALDVFAAGP